MRRSGREVARRVAVVLGEGLCSYIVLSPYPLLYGFATNPKWSSPPAGPAAGGLVLALLVSPLALWLAVFRRFPAFRRRGRDAFRSWVAAGGMVLPGVALWTWTPITALGCLLMLATLHVVLWLLALLVLRRQVRP